MNVLLLTPPDRGGIVADMSDFFDKSGGKYPPMGLLYLASNIKKCSGHEVSVIDASVEGWTHNELGGFVRACRPDVVGITALTFNLPDVLDAARTVKEANPNSLIVLGGPHPTIYPDETLAFQCVDFVVLGEGEDVFVQLLDRLASGMSLRGMKSLGWKEDGRTFINREYSFIEALDRIPFPAIDMTNHEKYCSVMSSEAKSTVMMSSRGCPFSCIYCDRPHLGKRFRARSAANVVDEMTICVEKYGFGDIKFFDDTFTVNRDRVLAIAAEIRRRGLPVTWSCRARVNTVDLELLKAMQAGGLVSVSFGIESGNQKTLDLLEKGTTIAQVKAAVSHCRSLGIEVLGDFILGCPGEGREEIMCTINFAGSLGLDYAQFTIMTPFPSTRLYSMGMESGIIKSDYWREFAARPTRDFVTPVWEEKLSKKELVGLLKRAYRAFYFRPGYVLGRVRRMKSVGELLRKLGVFLSLIKLNVLSGEKLARNFKRGRWAK